MAKFGSGRQLQGPTRTVLDLKGVSETWRGRSGRLAAEAIVRLWSWAHEKKLYQCSGRFIEIMPLLAARYHARIAFDLLQGILRLLKSLLDCEQRSLMGFF